MAGSIYYSPFITYIMKRLFILQILLSFWILLFAQNNYRIGYTTNYGNSFGQTTLNYQQTYQGTYRSYDIPARPRKVSGYRGDGTYNPDIDGRGYWGRDSITFWGGSGWKYYYDEKKGIWYRKNENEEWDRWISVTGIYYHWSWFGSSGPTNPTTQYYNENPASPIGNPIIPLLIILLIYTFIKKKNLSGFSTKV